MCTAGDVKHTQRLLTTGPGRIRDVNWADLMSQPGEIQEDNYHITLKMKQGYFDPLSLMDFKILPEALAQLDDENFARAPVGTGPFRFKGLEKGQDGEQLVLTANPYYGARAGKEGKPLIPEIRFVVPHDPVGDFRAQKLHFPFDSSRRRPPRELQAAGPSVQIHKLPTRRITFLAVNHREKRQSALRNEEALRQHSSASMPSTAIKS